MILRKAYTVSPMRSPVLRSPRRDWPPGAAHFCPPEFQVIGEGAGADLAEAVGFREVFDGDDSATHEFRLKGKD